MTSADLRQRRDAVAAAATVVVVLGLVVAYFVTRGDDEPGPSATLLASLIPDGPQACAAGDLTAGPDTMETAAGTVYLTETLVLARDVEPCSVAGYPDVIVLSDGRPAGVATVPDDSLGHPEELTVLPDRTVRVALSWPVFHYCGPTTNDALRLLVGPGLTIEVPGFGPTSCNPGEGRPPVRVGPFTYVDPNADRGTVTGVVALNGGPALGTGEFVTSGVVEFAGHPDVYRAAIGQSGAFELELPAGRYEITVSTHQWNGGAPYSAGRFHSVAGELNQLNIVLPVR